VQISRRAFGRRALLAATVLGVAGCGKHKQPPKPRPTAVPDAQALTSARSIEELLLASYDAKIAHSSARHRAALQVERAIHATHLAALHPGAADTTDTAVVTDLRRTLRHSVSTLRGLALTATDGTNAALLASIAASHEVSAQ
jgi:hypothetical protein